MLQNKGESARVRRKSLYKRERKKRQNWLTKSSLTLSGRVAEPSRVKFQRRTRSQPSPVNGVNSREPSAGLQSVVCPRRVTCCSLLPSTFAPRPSYFSSSPFHATIPAKIFIR